VFGLGFWEIVIIVIAILVFVRPHDLPRFFHQVGRVYRDIMDFRKAAGTVLRRIEREVEDTARGGSKKESGDSGEAPEESHRSDETSK